MSSMVLKKSSGHQKVLTKVLKIVKQILICVRVEGSDSGGYIVDLFEDLVDIFEEILRKF